MEENIKTEATGEEVAPYADAAQNEAPPQSDTAKETDPSKEFDSLIKGKFKGEFQKRVQGIIDARFRKNKEAEALAQRERETMNLYRSLLDESTALKEIYPDFDLHLNLKDEQFKRLLSVPSVDMKTAYEICNKDKIISSAMASAALKARERTVEDILSIRSRPKESLSSGGSGAANDIRSLSKKERENLCRRAAAGERITLK